MLSSQLVSFRRIEDPQSVRKPIRQQYSPPGCQPHHKLPVHFPGNIIRYWPAAPQQISFHSQQARLVTIYNRAQDCLSADDALLAQSTRTISTLYPSVLTASSQAPQCVCQPLPAFQGTSCAPGCIPGASAWLPVSTGNPDATCNLCSGGPSKGARDDVLPIFRRRPGILDISLPC